MYSLDQLCYLTGMFLVLSNVYPNRVDASGSTTTVFVAVCVCTYDKSLICLLCLFFASTKEAL